MSADVLFIIHDVYQDDNEFPLNIAYLSSILEEEGYSVETYCMDIFHYTNEDLAKLLENNEYEIIGVGFMAARFKETIIDLCKVINKHKKDAWLVLGGHGPSPIPNYMLNTVKCDAVAVGEAERSILNILRDKKINDNKKIYKSNPIKKLDDIPLPAWHLFPMKEYIDCKVIPDMEKDDKIISIITTRGCTNRCTFCYRLEDFIRLRSIDNVLEEIIELHDRYGINTLNTNDELFLVSEKRQLAFENTLRKEKLDIKYTINARTDIFNKRIAKSLKDSGCIFVNVGFESSKQEVLDEMKKNTTIEQNIGVLNICKKEELDMGINFIWGYSKDSYESLMNNVELTKRFTQYKRVRTIRPVTPYPGSELYYIDISKKLLEGPDDFFNKFENSDLIAVNRTRYPLKICYKWLLEANSDLIFDHYKNTDGNMEEARNKIQSFADLYSGKNKTFRGLRHYEKNKR